MRSLAHAFVAMALAAMPTTGMAAEAPPPPSADHSDREKVTIYFGPNRYAIPRVDMGSGYRAPPGAPEHTKALAFMFLLPDMRPAALDPAEATRTGWHNQVTVLFEYDSRFDNFHHQLDDYMNTAHMQKVDILPRVGSCDVYKGDFVTTREIHVCNNDGRLFVAKCAGAFPWEIFPDCKIYEDISDKSTAIISFAKAHIEQILYIEKTAFDYLSVHKY